MLEPYFRILIVIGIRYHFFHVTSYCFDIYDSSNFLYFRKEVQIYMQSSLVEVSPLMLIMLLNHILMMVKFHICMFIENYYKL